MVDTFLTKYRPKTFEEFWGNDRAVTGLITTLQRDDVPHCFLITGPSGIGKTTLARLIGDWFMADVHEVIASVQSGVDAARDLVQELQYVPLGGRRLMVIIDECHALSKQAWDALLGITENPPDHLCMAFCTTEPDKVPKAFRNQRLYTLTLAPLADYEMLNFVDSIQRMENLPREYKIQDAIVAAAEGLPRKALNLIEAVGDNTDIDQVRSILAGIDTEEGGTVAELARNLLAQLREGRGSWADAAAILASLGPTDYDNTMIGLCRYMCKVMENDEGSWAAWTVLNALTFPTVSNDAKIRLYTAVGRIFHGE